MKSEWKQLNLVDYLNGTLEPAEKKKVEDALEQDAKLRTEVALMRREIEMMRNAGHDPHSDIRVAGIHDTVMGRIKAEKHSPVMFNSAWLSYFRAVGVVVLLIVALALFFILKPVENPTVQNETRALPAQTIPSEKPAPKQLTLRLKTSKPKINLQWTLDPEFPQMD